MNINDLPFLPVVYLNKLVELMAEERIQAEYILRDCGINASVLNKPEAFLSVYQVRAVVSHYLGLTAQSHAAIRYGQRLDLMTHGLFGFVFTSRLPFREFMTTIYHYLQVRLPLLVLEMRHENDYIALRVSYKQPLNELEAFVTQAFLTSLYTLVSLISKNISLHFQSHILSNTHNLEQVLAAHIELNASYNEIRFYAAESHQTRLPTTVNLQTTEHDPFYEHSLVVRMRNYILRHVDEALSAEDVANHLNMSVRTLRRRLADIGMSFNEIRLEVRMQTAQRYLKTSNQSIERIANLVGYSDQASFTRAFQKWSNETPDTLRRRYRVKQQHGHKHTQTAATIINTH
ncbi:helix-turn-helix transcriptional regulator [Agitococcus lubricus]|uniref:AraC-like DNA-binding protein n=1 Tax=Agitococcus lubricus TaxID=1077255 RepID=A0A2T5J0X1_9GAMM|nr:response regulator transcription factor [Agitococcus lubricus]PTQ90013.1 AraC-like DNA-binding protein [Agitococcus lubricus]